MTFELITLIILAIVIVVREFANYKQIKHLQEIINSQTVKVEKTQEKQRELENENLILKTENDITKNEVDFDIRKASKVIIDGFERDISIISDEVK